MDVNNICRCCLSNDDPLLTIFEGGATTEDCLAAMYNKITGIKADPDDKLPDKVCLLCIRDIKNFYVFQKKCEISHRTLRQLCLANVEVQLNSSIENLQTKDTIKKEDLIIVGEYEITHLDSTKQTQTKEHDNYSQSAMFDTNVELANPINYVNEVLVTAENGICIENSPNSLEKAGWTIETNTHLENSTQTQPSTSTIGEIPYKIELTDSETDSNEPIGALEELGDIYNTNHDAEVTEIIALNSPQWVPEEEIDLSIVKEDFNSDVERHQINQLKVKRLKTRNLTCDICLKQFKTAANLRCHRRIHTGERPFKCKYCDSTFVQASTRMNHEKTHTGERKYKCKFCDKTFIQSGGLKNHEKVHTGEKPYKCKYCQRRFTRISARLRHEDTHIELTKKDGRFKCQFCIKTFAKIERRTKHEQLHKEEKPHKCRYCQRGFTQLSIKARHEEAHKRPDTDSGRFKCQYCDKTFISNENRSAHEIAHTRGKPHKCQYCGKGFYQLNVKNTHENTHKRSVIKCPQCDIQFVSATEVLEHFKTQHT